MLLACFGGVKTAGKARPSVDARLKARGDVLLDSVVFRVDAKHKAFGVVFGALARAVDGGGLGGALKGALVTGVACGIFGIFAGALFGLWAGRAVSARKIKSVGPLLAPGTSLVVAWADKPVTDDTLAPYLAPGSQRLIQRVNPVEGGAILEGG